MFILHIYALVDIRSSFLRSQSCLSDGIERVFEKEFFCKMIKKLSSDLKLVGFHWKDFRFHSKYSIRQNRVKKEKKRVNTVDGLIP